jgi:hypothetical protein
MAGENKKHAVQQGGELKELLWSHFNVLNRLLSKGCKMRFNKLLTIIFIFAFVSTDSISQTFQGTMYRQVKNKTQNIPVQFDLVIPDGSGEVHGTYFYRKIGEKIDLTGNFDGQTITLTEKNTKSGKITGIFSLKFGEQLSGTWHKPDGTDTFNVILNWVYTNTDSIKSPDSIDGFWEGVIGKDSVRFFLKNGDEPYGVYYLLSEKLLIGCDFNPSDSTITEIYSDYPVQNVKGGIWKYSYISGDTIRGTIREYLHYNTEYEPGTRFALVRRQHSFCNVFYGSLDSAFVINVEYTTQYNDELSISKISVHNSGLHYSGIRINSPIPNQSKINQLLRTIIPLDGELKDQILQKRKGDCTTPYDYEDYADMEVIDWGNRYLTVMIEQGEFPRYLHFSAVIIDRQKAKIVDPLGWFKDSLKCLAYKSSSEYQNYYMEDKCEEVFRNFFLNLSKAGIVKMQSVETDNRFFVIDDNVIEFDEAIISPSDDGITFHLHKDNSIDEFYKVSISFDDIKKFLSPAGIEALKPEK